MTAPVALVPWWSDPAWQTIPWTSPRCGTTTAGTRALSVAAGNLESEESNGPG
jgi:hypothetical protein